jgi:PAS domain S-box-containing protein
MTLIDVTEQTRLQRQLVDEQAKLNAAAVASNLAFWEMDLATGHTSFSRLKADSLGYQPEQFTHYEDFTALIHPHDYERVMNTMRAHLDGKVPLYEVEYRIRTSEQRYLWFKDLGQVTKRDEQGAPLVIVGITSDTTEMHKLIEALDMARSEKQEIMLQLMNLQREVTTPEE